MTAYGTLDAAEIARVEALVREVPDSAGLGAYLAFLYDSAGRYEQAVRIYESLIEHGYMVAEQRFHLGNCRYRQNFLARSSTRSKPPGEVGRMPDEVVSYVNVRPQHDDAGLTGIGPSRPADAPPAAPGPAAGPRPGRRTAGPRR